MTDERSGAADAISKQRKHASSLEDTEPLTPVTPAHVRTGSATARTGSDATLIGFGLAESPVQAWRSDRKERTANDAKPSGALDKAADRADRQGYKAMALGGNTNSASAIGAQKAISMMGVAARIMMAKSKLKEKASGSRSAWLALVDESLQSAKAVNERWLWKTTSGIFVDYRAYLAERERPIEISLSAFVVADFQRRFGPRFREQLTQLLKNVYTLETTRARRFRSFLGHSPELNAAICCAFLADLETVREVRVRNPVTAGGRRCSTGVANQCTELVRIDHLLGLCAQPPELTGFDESACKRIADAFCGLPNLSATPHSSHLVDVDEVRQPCLWAQPHRRVRVCVRACAPAL